MNQRKNKIFDDRSPYAFLNAFKINLHKLSLKVK